LDCNAANRGRADPSEHLNGEDMIESRKAELLSNRAAAQENAFEWLHGNDGSQRTRRKTKEEVKTQGNQAAVTSRMSSSSWQESA
jgi:hypothetical protein